MALSLLKPSLLVLLLGSFVVAEPEVLIPSSKVTYRGTVEDSVEHFQNIKFAHDTSGKRRFAPPEPFVPPPDSVIDATSPGHSCPQIKDAMPPFFAATEDMSEDCLNLRIARSENTKSDSKLPVVVWVHGGAVVKGSAYDPHFDPNPLIKLSVSEGKPVIYAAIHYRVLLFGFARLPELKDQKSLNAGMRDQRVGLQWIKDNIEAFGGDPDKITAYGLSAGGTFLSLHPMMYGGEQGVPFNQAWMMSGPPGTAVNMTSDATELHTLAVAEKVGCGDSNDKVDCLRNVPMADLLTAALEYAAAFHPPAGTFTFIPSVDDEFFPDRATNLYRSGRFVKGIPMVYGWTQDDGAMNVGLPSALETEEDIKTPMKVFYHALTDEQFSTIFSLYPASDFEQELQSYEARFPDTPVPIHFFRASRIMRDMLFTCSSIEFGYNMVKHTQQQNPDFTSVRLYDLNQSIFTPLWQGAGMPFIGVSHGSDNPYIFNGVFPEGAMSEEDQKLSELLTKSFINFAYTGDPSLPDVPNQDFGAWPPSFTRFGSGDMPTSLSMQVIGGPYGTGVVPLGDPTDSETSNQTDSYLDRMQQVVGNILDFGSMDSATSRARVRQIEQEKLLERCAFINSLSEAVGN